MFVRKLSIRARAGAGSLQKTPKQNHLRLFTLLTLGTGAVSGFAALVIGAFLTNVQAAAATYLHSNRSADPIQAATLFPAVPAVTKVIDVYDPPPVAAQPRPAQSAPAAASRPHEGSPPIHSTPSQPGHDD